MTGREIMWRRRWGKEQSTERGERRREEREHLSRRRKSNCEIINKLEITGGGSG